jgi:hypothetical protein
LCLFAKFRHRILSLLARDRYTSHLFTHILRPCRHSVDASFRLDSDRSQFRRAPVIGDALLTKGRAHFQIEPIISGRYLIELIIDIDKTLLFAGEI